MAEETPRRPPDETREAEEPVFRHLDKIEWPDLRTIESMAGLLNLAQQTVMLAVNRLERNGRIFGERRRAWGGWRLGALITHHLRSLNRCSDAAGRATGPSPSAAPVRRPALHASSPSAMLIRTALYSTRILRALVVRAHDALDLLVDQDGNHRVPEI